MTAKEKYIPKQAKTGKLRESALAQAKEIINALHDPLLMVGSNLKIITANELFYSTFKTTKEKTKGKSIFDLEQAQWNTTDLRKLLKKILSKKSTDKNVETTHRLHYSKGKALVLKTKQLTIGTIQEQVILVAFEDTTERNQSKELQTLFEQASVALAILKGTNYVIEAANTQVCSFWGKTREQVLGKPLFEALPEIQGQGFEALLQTVMKTGKPFVGKEHPAEVMDQGKIKKSYFDFVYKPMLEVDGTVSGIILTATDATERVEERRKVEASETRYQTLFDSMDEGFCIIEVIFDAENKPIDYCFLEINQAFEKQTGISNIKSKRIRELYPLHEQYWYDIFGQVALTGEAVRFENYSSHVNLWFEVHAFPVDLMGECRVGIVFNDITERKQTDETVRQSEQRFQAAALAVSSIIWTGNSQGVMEGEQPGWAQFTGQTKEEYQGYGWAKAVHPDDRQATIEAWNAAVQEKLPAKFAHRARRHDGVWRSFSVRAVPTFAPDGNILEWVGVHHDITERMHEEDTLRQSEERYRTLVELGPIAVFRCDEAGVIQDYNHRAAELWGREPKRGDPKERFCGSLMLCRMDGSLLSHDESAIVNVLRTGVPESNVEVTIVRPDQSRIIVLAHFAPLKNEQRKVVGAIASFLDITERQEAEKKIYKLNEELEKKVSERTMQLNEKISELKLTTVRDGAILASIGEAFVVVDEKGYITFVNKIFEELLGWKKEEVMGKKMVDIIPHEDEDGNVVPPQDRLLSQVLSGTEKASSKIRVSSSYYTYKVRKDGTRFPVAGVVSPILLGKKIIGAEQVFRDITREQQIDKAKSEFVSLASHQLRTPTTSINWYSEMLLAEEVGTLNEKQKQYCEEIHHGNQRMIDLMNALLTVSRIELGTYAIVPVSVNITEIAEDVLKELQASIVEKALRIDRKYQYGSSHIVSDPTMIRIIFQNLLANAVEYSPTGAKITLEIKENTEDVLIKVVDKGCGVPKSSQPKLFTKFFRAPNAQAMKPDGTGLGLYITKSIAEGLSGTISFTSKENQGTAFFVTLPSLRTSK